MLGPFSYHFLLPTLKVHTAFYSNLIFSFVHARGKLRFCLYVLFMLS